MELPVFFLDIQEGADDATAVNYVAMVEKPAIERDWQAFNSTAAKFSADEEKRIVSGPLMIADMLIYRKDDKFGEYYSVFDSKTIEKIAIKFYQKGFQSNVNLMHDEGMIVEGATMFESWIVDRAKNKMPMKGYEDITDGSWFGSFKVNNDKVWQMVKDGLVKGFSVEGLFDYKQSAPVLTEEQKLEKIKQLLSI